MHAEDLIREIDEFFQEQRLVQTVEVAFGGLAHSPHLTPGERAWVAEVQAALSTGLMSLAESPAIATDINRLHLHDHLARHRPTVLNVTTC